MNHGTQEALNKYLLNNLKRGMIMKTELNGNDHQ